MPIPQPKTIWYCHHYAGSPSLGMSYRPYYFTRTFRQQGHNAFVISAAFHHLLLAPQNQQEKIEKKNIDGVPFILLKTRPYKGNGISRVLNMLDYARIFKQNYDKIISLTGKPDVIIVSSAHPFHFPILKKISKKFNAKLIFEVRDLWPLSLQVLLNKSALHPIILYLSYLEKKAYSQADLVVSVLKNSLAYMKIRGLREDKFHYISNGVCLKEKTKEKPLPENHLSAINNLDGNIFKLGYAGALGKPNAMNYLLDAMQLLQKKNIPIHLFIVGDGHLKYELINQSKQLGLANTTFLPKISKHAIPNFLKHMDVLFLGWQPSELYKYGVSPNKIFDYLASGKPIIESGGDQNGILSAVNCGYQCEPAKPYEIANCIEKLSRFTHQKRTDLGKNGLSYVTLYEYEILGKKYSQLF